MSLQYITPDEILHSLQGVLKRDSPRLFASVIRSRFNWYTVLLSVFLCEIKRRDVGILYPLLSSSHLAFKLFIGLFIIRYARLLVNFIGYWQYTSKPPGPSSIFLPNNVTVIVPTVDPAGINFKECIRSIHKTGPALIIIVAAGNSEIYRQTNFQVLIQDFVGYPGTRIMECRSMNKRKQLYTALLEVSQSNKGH